MLLFLLSCFSFVFFLSKSLFLPPLPPWAGEARLLSLPPSSALLGLLRRRRKTLILAAKADPTAGISILDLPDLALEIVLGKLPPSGLCAMAAVCRSFRHRCGIDRLWSRHLEEKWGRLLEFIPDQKNSIMAFYRSIETGRLCFPAQIFNRENGHPGFMLSCYDAEVSYDSVTDTFMARYPPHGRRAAAIEEDVTWERLRAPPVSASAYDLYSSNSLANLRPGDHVEVQWRRNKEFPYGWWYGVVGHLAPCSGDELHCHCGTSGEVVLEFKQYSAGSRWRRAILRREGSQEEGNEVAGFYGGVRKLNRRDEIAAWLRLLPTTSLD
ncbi:F-box protein At2g32560-like [Wolffia australiana]